MKPNPRTYADAENAEEEEAQNSRVFRQPFQSVFLGT